MLRILLRLRTALLWDLPLKKHCLRHDRLCGVWRECRHTRV